MARRVAERADVLPALAEVFREHGYEGASLGLIGQRTNLGKGSLYHFFPGGKAEMAEAVLSDIAAWFETEVFTPLARAETGACAPEEAIAAMLRAVDGYFQSGRRICLVGAFALADTRDRFAAQVDAYFARWTGALAKALQGAGLAPEAAAELAEDAVLRIQGALVLARARGEPAVFSRGLRRLEGDIREILARSAGADA